MPPVGLSFVLAPARWVWLCCASLKVGTRGVAAAATGATRPHAQSQVAPSVELNRPIVCFRAVAIQSLSSSTSG